MRVSLFAILLMVSTFVFTLSKGYSAVVNTQDVNVRMSDTIHSKRVLPYGQLKKGQVVWVKKVGKKQTLKLYGTHYWFYVIYSPKNGPHTRGWIFGALLSFKITQDGVNFRDKPTLKSKVITILKRDTKISKILLIHNGVNGKPLWCKVKLETGQIGWVNYNYIE